MADETDFRALMYGRETEPTETPEDLIEATEGQGSKVLRIRVGPITYQVPSLSYMSSLERRFTLTETTALPARDPRVAQLEKRLDEALAKIGRLQTSISALQRFGHQQRQQVREMSSELSNKVTKNS